MILTFLFLAKHSLQVKKEPPGYVATHPFCHWQKEVDSMREDEDVRSLLATTLTMLDVSVKDIRHLELSCVFHILGRGRAKGRGQGPWSENLQRGHLM